MKNKLAWGCIADDFTGASDAASFFVKGGMRTILYSGVPKEDARPGDCQAAVIALKTRTQETEAAVLETLRAARWLKNQGAGHLYIKYCSTFDSTPQGNIGPILDALLEEYGIPYTILCPALPVNGRIVRQGHLFVNGVPLHESPMKDHPLTPMWDSSIEKLMEPQSKYPCIHVTGEQYAKPKEEILAGIDAFGQTHPHFYVIPDYEREEDASVIADLFGSLPLLSGGSGVLTELARRECVLQQDGCQGHCGQCGAKAGLILAGSCSEMTRKQIRYAQEHGIESLKIRPLDLLSGTQTLKELWEFAEQRKGKDVLLYSSDSPDQVMEIQAAGKEKVAKLLEQTMAELAKLAVEAGFTKIIVAGGETSGAVTRALEFDSYIIGESVAPGVPVMMPENRAGMRLVLKSGNFGQEDFFIKALKLTDES